MAYKNINTQEELIEYINSIIKDVSGLTVIQAGHFALVQEENSKQLIPAITEDINSDKLKSIISSNPYMGEFPIKTWLAATEIIKSNLAKKIMLSIIVNDWQWVKKSVNSEKNNYRTQFYSTHQMLPNSYKNILYKNNISENSILPLVSDKNRNIFFGEQKLRNIATRRYKHIRIDQYAKSCAFSYIPFLEYLEKYGTELLISFIPSTCKNAIDYGTNLFIDDWMFDTNLKIINIFIDGIFKNDFFEQTNVITYNI